MEAITRFARTDSTISLGLLDFVWSAKQGQSIVYQGIAKSDVWLNNVFPACGVASLLQIK
jgi:hypothetical protein